MAERTRNLVLVLGDQLDRGSAAFDGFDRADDAVLMMEVAEEATYIPQHKARLAVFFSAMRHFRDALRDEDVPVHYVELDDRNNRGSHAGEVGRWANKLRPERLIVLHPGDWRVLRNLRRAADEAGLPLEVREDRHFLCGREDFDDFASRHRSWLLETFYREMRSRHGVLMTESGGPVEGRWNFDKENRKSFGKKGPGHIKAPRSFRTDDVTDGVVELVSSRFSDSPGSLENFDFPVTGAQAKQALCDFLDHRLARFGDFQDAMVAGRPFLYHSRLSVALNLHLLDPRDAIDAAVDRYEQGQAPIASVEGFVRQILGWREFVRGVYWHEMPDYAGRNALGADLPMPRFMWTGETEMRCVAESVGQLVEHAYAHHIQRLMVLGQFALLVGVKPYDVHRWHISMYADAVDWVSLPNVLGMSQFADGGTVGTKPYCASGRYIDRMSDYCGQCRFDPAKASGEDACPFTTLYWDFLARHRARFRGNRRMKFQIANLDRKETAEVREIRRAADRLKSDATAETWL